MSFEAAPFEVVSTSKFSVVEVNTGGSSKAKASEAPKESKKKKKEAVKPTAPGENPAADKLKEGITAAGNQVRDLKKAGKAKDDPALTGALKQMLALKAELKALTGEEFPPKAAKKKKGGKGGGEAPPPTPSPSPAAPAAPAAPSAAAPAEGDKKGQVITPWEVEGDDEGIDYDKLIRDFGSSKIEPTLLQKIERITEERPHHWLRRGLFFSHRDMTSLLDNYEKGENFYLYTGRGPSSDSLHLGHLIPFTFTRYLQRVFKAPLVVQLTDDEKFLWKDLALEKCHELAYSNTKDIIACGFELEKTFIFSDLNYIGNMYRNICKIQKCVTFNQARGIFGFEGGSNIGQVAFPAIQAAPSFATSFPVVLGGSTQWADTKQAKKFPCLIPCAIDQDPYFRMTRDVAPRLGLLKPALIHSKFFPALQGSKTKMSASAVNTSIYVSDTPKQIKKKINKYCYSGGGETVELHRKFGGNCEIDCAYQYLYFFMEDDERLEEIRKDYSAGRMMSGEIKAELINCLIPLVENHQKRKAEVTDEMVEQFMEVRKLTY